MSGEARDYEEFTRLKEEAFGTIDQDNAEEKLKSVKEQIITALQKLDVNDITEVEDLYLIVAQLTQAATFVDAKNKMVLKDLSFEDALDTVGTDDLLSVLNQTFVSQPEVGNFFKFVTIDETYGPSKEAWAGLHARMALIARIIAAAAAARDKILQDLKVTVTDYLAHLEAKLKENGVNIPLPAPKQGEAESADDNHPPIIHKLIARYKAIEELYNKIIIAQHLSEEDITLAKTIINKCIKNRPFWSERPFIIRLADTLSLGLTYLYRSFFSKEKKFQETMEQTVNSIQKGP